MTNLLSQIPLLSDLPVKELDHLVTTLKVVELQPREVLFSEGEAGEHFYVVAYGELEILRAAGTADELLLNVISQGEYLGEMSLIMPGGHRTATVRARTPSTLLVMSRAEFDDLLKRFPLLAYSMVRVLSQRLDATNTSTFRDLTDKNRQLQKAYDELKAAQEQIIEKERLEKELSVAADIQMSILPDRLPEPAGFDFGATMDPARQVGGDFYDIFTLNKNRIAVVIGDVADKGVPSAIFMARTHALIMAESDNTSDPGKLLRVVNSHITRLEKSTQFVTVLYGVLDLRTGDFNYARAGHEPPLLLSPNGEVTRIAHTPGMALGIWEDITLDEKQIRLEPGSTLLLYTDGMTDCRDPLGEDFGLERIKQNLAQMVGRTAQDVCDHMLSTLRGHQHGSPQDDDVTLAAIHVS
jgi:sigma-B regulation protein RsbU (phosphoserine phosphatase)